MLTFCMYISLCMYVYSKTLSNIDVGRKEINLYYRLPVLQINITLYEL